MLSSLYSAGYVSWCVPESVPLTQSLSTSEDLSSPSPESISLLPAPRSGTSGSGTSGSGTSGSGTSGSGTSGSGTSGSGTSGSGTSGSGTSGSGTSGSGTSGSGTSGGPGRPTLSFRDFHHAQTKPNTPPTKHVCSDDSDGEEGRREGTGSPEAERRSKGDQVLLNPQDKDFKLPRSSPVISRRRKSLSCHGGDTIGGPVLSRSWSPAPADREQTFQGGQEPARAPETPETTPNTRHHPAAVREDRKSRCISVSSNLNHFLSAALHLPFRGHQGLAEERSGRGSWACCSSTDHTRPETQHPVNRSISSSDIPQCSADIFKTSFELEKENAHFIVVDMVLEVLETVKWSLSQTTSTDTHTHHSAEHTHTHHSAEHTHRHQHTWRSRGTRRRRWLPEPDTRKHTHCIVGDTLAHKHTQSPADLNTHEDRQSSEMETHTHKHTQHYKGHNHKQTPGQNNEGTHADKQDHEEDSHRDTHRPASDTYTHPHTHEEEEERPGSDDVTQQMKALSLLSTDSGFEDCSVDKILTTRGSLRKSLRCPMMHSGVECLAQQLVLGFRRSWLPSQEPRGGRHSLRTSLQELPGTGGVEVSGGRGSLTEEIRLRYRMRGTWTWAPPRCQIIFTVQPTHRRSEVVSLQHFLCAGCGTEVEPKYIKKLRYCEYFGRYFCDCCHAGSEAVIPGRVLTHWDFSRYPVSDFSKQLLDSVWLQPLYDLTSLGKTLRVRELDRFRELQEQLISIRRLLAACRLSDRVMSEFEQLPGHLLQQPHLFSMDDLLRVKKGQLVPLARAVLCASTAHIDTCQLCLARGFICEFCRKSDILFPFQSETCKRCPACKACFHKHCLTRKNCPKCARLKLRRQLLDDELSVVHDPE